MRQGDERALTPLPSWGVPVTLVAAFGRWYYYDDKLGVAIFQDMPQKYLAQGRSNATVQHYVSDMKAMVRDPGKGVRVVRIERWEKGKLEWCRYATIFIEVIFEG